MNFEFIKKIIVFSVIFGLIFLVSPQKAQAQAESLLFETGGLPPGGGVLKTAVGKAAPQFTFETNPVLVGGGAASTKTSIETTAKNIFDFGNFAKKIAGQLLKKILLDRLVDALVAYISGQRDTIIEDWDKFFQKAEDDAIGLLAEKITNGMICNNFDLNLRTLLIPIDPFSKNIKCSLDQIGFNIDSFINNFENGSWAGYQGQWYPQNNFYGTMLTLLDERSLQTAKAKDTAANQTSGGFLSQVKCNPPGSNKNCKVVTPGSFIANQINKGLGIEKDILGVITADDIAGYITAIVNAGVNRLAIMGTEGLKGILKKNTAQVTTATPQNPCAGLTGDAFRACQGFQSASKNSFQSGRYYVQNQFNSTVQPRRNAANSLLQLISAQEELVSDLEALNACKPGNANTQNQLTQETAALEDLQNKFDDNQTFLEPLEESSTEISGLEEDWTALSSRLINGQPLLDPDAASQFQSDIETEKTAILENISASLPAVKAELSGCPSAPTQ